MSTTNRTTIASAILLLLDQHGEISGVEHLAFDQLNCFNRTWVNNILRRLEASGQISIINAGRGRGHRTIIKRNRNQPDQARRRHG